MNNITNHGIFGWATVPKRMRLVNSWKKSRNNPVLGGALGTCFDMSVLRDNEMFRMWFSWRPRDAIAYTDSIDGAHWTRPVVVLQPTIGSWLEPKVNRPSVIRLDGKYHMWFTEQSRDASWIGYATSGDGIAWTRVRSSPVLVPERAWEKVAVMCPDVMWDAQTNRFRMWYSGGEQYEPDAIGYCESSDGMNWTRPFDNPIFRPDRSLPWEASKVTGACVRVHDSWHVMFYIGFSDINTAAIGIARSPDGFSNWQRHPANPIIRRGNWWFSWDRDAVYKPSALLVENNWLLWYNGRRGGTEQIGLALHAGADLGF